MNNLRNKAYLDSVSGSILKANQSMSHIRFNELPSHVLDAVKQLDVKLRECAALVSSLKHLAKTMVSANETTAPAERSIAAIKRQKSTFTGIRATDLPPILTLQQFCDYLEQKKIECGGKNKFWDEPAKVADWLQQKGIFVELPEEKENDNSTRPQEQGRLHA